MKTPLLYFFWITCFLSSYFIHAQSYTSLSSHEKLEIRLQSRVLFHLDSIHLTELDSLVKNAIPIAIYLSQFEQKNDDFIERFLHSNNKIMVLSEEDVSNFNSKSIVGISKTDLDSIHIGKSGGDQDISRFVGMEELGLVTIQDGMTLVDSVFVNIWGDSGKLPNFIYANSASLNQISEIVTTLNSLPKVFGVVRSEEALLNDVSFENFRNRNVNGAFVLPMEGEGIIPHKAGYYFSPDIIIPNQENKGNLKEFVGYPLESDYRLDYHFTFGKEVKNIVKNGNNEFLSNSVVTEKDSLRGKVGYFSNRAYIDTGIAGKTALKSNFSITAWIKPTELSAANGILSKGFNFVVKIHQGYLTFTSAGIKDYESLSSPTPINEWTHIGLVHSSINNDLTFYINGMQTDKIEMISEYKNSEYNLLVGNNIWEEFFVGYLSAIKIWERELNANEILAEYENEEFSSIDQTTLFVIFTGISIFIFISVWFFKKLKRKMRTLPTRRTNYSIKDTKVDFKEQILCFGQLRIETDEGVDVANKFSPMLKKLFVVIFLHSQKRAKGISTKNLTEYIWPGMDAKRAKNTRGTTIQNLRSILVDCPEIALVFNDKLWSIEIGETCYCDFLEALAILEVITENDYSIDILENELPRLLSALSKGRFFSNSSEPWLDPFVEKFSMQLMEHCFKFAEKLSLQDHYELLFSISEVIYLYDDLNEKALELKLRVLVHQGKFSLARSVFDNFVSLYKKIYKELYPFDFDQFLSEKSIK